MAGVQFNLIKDAPRITSLKGVLPRELRLKLEQRHAYYEGLIEFCIQNQDQEGAEELVKDFTLELADCFKYIMEDSRQSASSRKEKIRMLVQIARKGFGDYLSAPMVRYSERKKEFAVNYGWSKPFAVLTLPPKERAVAAYLTGHPEFVQTLKGIIEDQEASLQQHMLENMPDPRLRFRLNRGQNL